MKKLIYLSLLFFCLTGIMCACGKNSMVGNENTADIDYRKNGSNSVDPKKEADEAAVETVDELTAFERLFSNGSIPAQDENGLWGYLDILGNYTIAPSFFGAKPFSNNEMAFVQDMETQLWGLIDKSGKYVVEPMFLKMGDSFCNNLLRVLVPDRGWGYINQSGEMVIEPQFKKVYDFSQGFARVSNQMGITTDSQTGAQYQYYKYGFINTTGERITEDIFSDAHDFSGGLALVKEGDYYGGFYGYIDTSGEFVIDPSEHFYKEATSFINGRAFACRERTQRNHYELIDKEGNILREDISASRESLSSYCGSGVFTSDLRAVLLPDGRGYVYIDIDGNIVLPSASEQYYGEAG